MPNMSYCRFQNTSNDLDNCYEHIDDHDLSEEEERAKKELISLCVEIACYNGHEIGKECEIV